MNTTLEAVRTKVIEAIPELIERANQSHCGRCECMDGFGSEFSEIYLHDVLRAIGSYRYAINGLGNIYNTSTREEDQHVARWELSKSLDEQDKNVIEFLYRILCHD